MTIRFGTSGWRAIIADEFTFENVRLVTEAICRYLKENSSEDTKTLIVGHDSRFMGEKFSEVAAEIAKAKGFQSFALQSSDTDTDDFTRDQRSESGRRNKFYGFAQSAGISGNKIFDCRRRPGIA